MKKSREFADRLSYSLFNIPLPKNTARKDIDTIIRAKLRSLYPLSLDDKVILILKNTADRNSRIVIVCNHDFYEKNKQCVCSSFLAMKLLKKKTGTCVCIHSRFVEYVSLEKGCFVSGTVIPRKEPADIAQLYPENTIAVLFNAADIERSLITGNGNNKFRFFDVSVLSSAVVKKALFVRFSKEQKRNKLLLSLLIVVLFSAAGIIAMHQRIQMSAESRMMERAQAEALRIREAERKEKELLAENLEAEYTEAVLYMLPDMYDVCNKLFSSIDAGTKIDNLTISGNSFQFDAHGSDALKILTQFEENDFISGIYLNRVVVEGEDDSFTFEGNVKQHVMLPGSGDPVDDKIMFYQNALRRFQEEAAVKQSRRPSEISNSIRRILSDKRCRLESIQYYTTEYGLEIDYAIQAPSRAFFAFLSDVSRSDAYLVISSVRIRSYLEGGTLSAVVRFRTGIVTGEVYTGNEMRGEEIESFTPEELAEYFIRRRSIPVVQEVLPELEPEPVKIQSVVSNPGFLHYVGSAATSQGDQFVLIRDTRKDAIIRLSNNPEMQDYFISNGVSRLELKYEGTIYEVSK